MKNINRIDSTSSLQNASYIHIDLENRNIYTSFKSISDDTSVCFLVQKLYMKKRCTAFCAS